MGRDVSTHHPERSPAGYGGAKSKDPMNITTLIATEEIQKRIGELAKEIERDFSGNGEVTVIGVLKGSFIFMADLVRHFKIPIHCDFLRVSSYSHDVPTGSVRMEFDLTQPIAGQHILLVEDIVDSGRTLKYLLAHLKSKNPKSLKVASLLYKDIGKARDLIDYVGFTVPNEYVIGYGLDTEGLCRNLPYIGVVK
jgi:hypoxanthine phosphoribosyltransferase